MMRHKSIAKTILALTVFCALLAMGFLAPQNAHAQATVSTGNIQGTILDPDGGVVSKAKVTITNKDTGQKIDPEVTESGAYNSGPLAPGAYVVRVTAQGFKTHEQTMTVTVGVITPGNITLQVGAESTVITVEGAAIVVNTD